MEKTPSPSKTMSLLELLIALEDRGIIDLRTDGTGVQVLAGQRCDLDAVLEELHEPFTTHRPTLIRTLRRIRS
jgi:hypothetical protein